MSAYSNNLSILLFILLTILHKVIHEISGNFLCCEYYILYINLFLGVIMGKKGNKKKIDEVEVYTTVTFSNDDIAITIKNVSLSMLELFTDREVIIRQFMYKMWFMHGVYEVINIIGIDFIILKRTKRNIELMVKDKISDVIKINEEIIDIDYEETNNN